MWEIRDIKNRYQTQPLNEQQLLHNIKCRVRSILSEQCRTYQEFLPTVSSNRFFLEPLVFLLGIETSLFEIQDL